MKLDEKLWLQNKWNVPNKHRWYDGSFPMMREISNLSNEDLQQRYFDSIRENRIQGYKNGDEYFKSDALLCRIEIGRRIDEGLVRFEEEGQSKIEIKEEIDQETQLSVAIEEIDSFSKIATIPAESISDKLPVPPVFVFATP